MTKDQERELNRKLGILKYAEESGNVAKTCRYYGIPRSIFYLWRSRLRKGGEHALLRKKPIPQHQPNRTPDEIVEKGPLPLRNSETAIRQKEFQL